MRGTIFTTLLILSLVFLIINISSFIKAFNNEYDTTKSFKNTIRNYCIGFYMAYSSRKELLQEIKAEGIVYVTLKLFTISITNAIAIPFIPFILILIKIDDLGRDFAEKKLSLYNDL